MHEPIKNLRQKEYNPCGDLTGRERDFCDEATKSYFNLPYVEVMRAISIKAVAELEHATNFNNVAALENWATYNLNDVERRANLNFDTFTPLQAGLCKLPSLSTRRTLITLRRWKIGRRTILTTWSGARI